MTIVGDTVTDNLDDFMFRQRMRIRQELGMDWYPPSALAGTKPANPEDPDAVDVPEEPDPNRRDETVTGGLRGYRHRRR